MAQAGSRLKPPRGFAAAGWCRQVVSRAPRLRTSGVLPRPACTSCSSLGWPPGSAGTSCRGSHVFGPLACPHFPAAPRHGTFAWCFLAWAGPSRGVARAPGASLLRGSFALLSPLTLTSIARPGYYLSCQGRPTASSGSDSHQRFWLLGRLALRRLPRGGGRSRPLRGVGIGPRGCPGVLLIVGCSDSADAAALLAAASARRPTRGHRPLAHRWAARGSPWQSTLRAAMTGNVLPLPASAPLTAFSALSQDARPACLAAAAGPPMPL